MTEQFSFQLGEALAGIRKANVSWLLSDPPSVKDGLLTWLSHNLGLHRTQCLINCLDASHIDSSRILEAPYASAMGFYIDSAYIHGNISQICWSDSLETILSREPFTSDRRGIGHNPLVLLGLVLLALKVKLEKSIGNASRKYVVIQGLVRFLNYGSGCGSRLLHRVLVCKGCPVDRIKLFLIKAIER